MHWAPMKNIEVKNMHKNKYGNLNTILSIWYFKRNLFMDARLMKQKYILCTHVGIKLMGVKYRETYDPVVNLDKCKVDISYSKYT